MRGSSDRASTVYERTGLGNCNWNELLTADPAAGNTFYAKVFGWTYPDKMSMPGDLGASLRRRWPRSVSALSRPSHGALIYPARMASVRVDPERVLEFENEKSFYTWLGKHGAEWPEVWIKIHKVRSGLPSITPTEAIDVVLCWGWIDGIRKGFDEQSFLQRYTPRGKKSVWSQINVANVARLAKSGRMQPAGLAQVDAAKADGRWDKAYRMTDTKVPEDLLAALRASPKAWAMYETLTAQNRFALTFRTSSMKTEAGRQKKIASFVEMLTRGETPHPNGKGTPAKKSATKPRSSGESTKAARKRTSSRSTR